MNHSIVKLTDIPQIIVPEFVFNELTSSVRISIKILMALQTTEWGFLHLRRSLIIAGLISLCVSANVGPRFLPLPGVADCLAATRHESQKNKRLRLPSSNESDNFRVPMMVHTQKRAETDPQPQPLTTFEIISGVALPYRARAASEFSSKHLLIASAISQRLGRAPPLVV